MTTLPLLKGFNVTPRLNKFYAPRKLTLTDVKIDVQVDLPDEVVKELDKYNVVLAEFHSDVSDWFANKANFGDFIADWKYCDEEMWSEAFAKRDARATAVQKKFAAKFKSVYEEKWRKDIQALLNAAWKKHKAVGDKLKKFEIKCYLTISASVAGMVVATAAAIVSAPTGIGIAGAAIGYVQGIGTCYATYKKLSKSLDDQWQACETNYKALKKDFEAAQGAVQAAAKAAMKPGFAAKKTVQFKEALKVAGTTLTGGAADYILDVYNSKYSKPVASSLKSFIDSLDTIEAKIDGFEQGISDSSAKITSLLDEQVALVAAMDKLRTALSADIGQVESINRGASKDWSLKRKELGVCGLALQKNEQNLNKTLKSIVADETRLKSMKKTVKDWQKSCEQWEKTFGTKKIGTAVQMLVNAGAVMTGTGVTASAWAGIGTEAMGGLSVVIASKGTYEDTRDFLQSVKA